MDFHKLDRPFEDMIDLKWVIENSFRFPLTRYGLKEISDFLEKGSNGLQIIPDGTLNIVELKIEIE